VPTHRPPDLSSLGLEVERAGRTDLGGIESDAFTYRSSRSAVFVFFGSRTFPEAAGARERTGRVHGWEAVADGISLVCADRPVSYLLLGEDEALLRQVEAIVQSRPVTAG
jgi:hypothetical protein